MKSRFGTLLLAAALTAPFPLAASAGGGKDWNTAWATSHGSR